MISNRIMAYGGEVADGRHKFETKYLWYLLAGRSLIPHALASIRKLRYALASAYVCIPAEYSICRGAGSTR
jgi:hypothetical protein